MFRQEEDLLVHIRTIYEYCSILQYTAGVLQEDIRHPRDGAQCQSPLGYTAWIYCHCVPDRFQDMGSFARMHNIMHHVLCWTKHHKDREKGENVSTGRRCKIMWFCLMCVQVLVVCWYQVAVSFCPPRILRRIFPPIVTGTYLILLGVSLIGAGFQQWGGGTYCASQVSCLAPRSFAALWSWVMMFQNNPVVMLVLLPYIQQNSVRYPHNLGT